MNAMLAATVLLSNWTGGPLKVTDGPITFTLPAGLIVELTPDAGLVLDDGTNTVSLAATNWGARAENRITVGADAGGLRAQVVVDQTNRLAFFGGFAAALSLGGTVLALRYFRRTTGMGD